MKSLLVCLLALAVTACSSSGVKPPAAAATPVLATSSFEEAGGTLNLVFDAQGNWARITSQGSATLHDDSPSARETAMAIATLRAKRAMAEFMNNDIRSTRTLRRIVRNYERSFHASKGQPQDDAAIAEDAETDFAQGDAESTRVSSQLATMLTERIQNSSAAILKGVYVSRRSVESDRVVVEVVASRESVEAARQASRMMRGATQ